MKEQEGVRVKRVKRSDAVEGNLVKVTDPAFISLVGKPANQRPFPVIRSADGKTAPRVTRTKRDDSPVLMITFPADYDEADVGEALDLYGMSGYTVISEGGSFVAVRSDLQSVAKVAELSPSTIRLTSDGIIASINAEQFAPTGGKSVAGVAIVRYEFDKKTFDEDATKAWLSENSIDFSKDAIENSASDVISVVRKDIAADTDVRRMELVAGVVAVITRDDVTDVPAAFIAVVNEAAYGNWGWGQLDFNATMADRAFCEMLEDAEWQLERVIRNILFYSELPLDARKQLVTRSLTQYGAFINNAIDTLPRQVLQLVARSVARSAVEPKQEKDTMTKEQIEAKRAEDEAATLAAAEAAKPVLRGELAELVTAAVASAMATRSEPVAAVVVEPVVAVVTEAAPVAGAAPAAVVGITRADIEEIMKAQFAPVTERLDKIEGTTIVRSDNGDGTQTVPVKAKREDAFKGVLSFGSKAAEQ